MHIALNSFDPSWLLTFLFTHFLLHILTGIRSGGEGGEEGGEEGREGGERGEGGGEYEIITNTSNEAKNNNGKYTMLSYCRLI
jgi:hypothetical protein